MSKTALLLAAVFLVIGGISAFDAITGGSETPIPTGTPTPQQSGNRWSVAITATDDGFESVLDALPPGTAALEFLNETDSPQELQVFRLDDDVDYGDFAAAVSRSGRDARLFRRSSPVGGIGAGGGIAPGASSRLVLDLPVGIYAFVSFIDDGYKKGMIRRFDVQPGEAAPAGIPSTAGEIVINDDTFSLPSRTLAQGVYRVSNGGTVVHEAAIFRLNGAVDALIETLHSDTSDEAGGAGFGTLAPDLTMYSQLNLEPGTYAFVCRVTDPDTGRPFYEIGMISPFTVE